MLVFASDRVVYKFKARLGFQTSAIHGQSLGPNHRYLFKKHFVGENLYLLDNRLIWKTAILWLNSLAVGNEILNVTLNLSKSDFQN